MLARRWGHRGDVGQQAPQVHLQGGELRERRGPLREARSETWGPKVARRGEVAVREHRQDEEEELGRREGEEPQEESGVRGQPERLAATLERWQHPISRRLLHGTQEAQSALEANAPAWFEHGQLEAAMARSEAESGKSPCWQPHLS